MVQAKVYVSLVSYLMAPIGPRRIPIFSAACLFVAGVNVLGIFGRQQGLAFHLLTGHGTVASLQHAGRPCSYDAILERRRGVICLARKGTVRRQSFLERFIVDIPELRSAKIAITPCPGKRERDLGQDLDQLSSWGAQAVVTLVQDHELDMLKVPNMKSEASKSGTFFRLQGRWHRTSGHTRSDALGRAWCGYASRGTSPSAQCSPWSGGDVGARALRAGGHACFQEGAVKYRSSALPKHIDS
mmetsp:Transcript_29210/g.62105  ORF Transcript_29210/g.62105 Transcript_29210/m.62105 type:complete len:243 (-) Transcript_29210:25-753(-)